uniref:Reverse transcriptase Ty1/copia-type domain-containing protein n=1 Tax=Tanacetum cinerariifolium TaxID=118510 RepID=A0A6L2L440_TANCI|nr:hypothetical protein [Tanacetum cinerariifolium]
MLLMTYDTYSRPLGLVRTITSGPWPNKIDNKHNGPELSPESHCHIPDTTRQMRIGHKLLPQTISGLVTSAEDNPRSQKKLKGPRSVQHSESRTPNVRVEPGRRRRSRRSCSMYKSPELTSSVFSRIRRDRLKSPRHRLRNKERRERGVFNRMGVKKEVCPHTRKAVTKVPIQKKQNPSPESVTMKEHLHGERNQSRKVKIAKEDTGSQDQKKSSTEEDDLSQPWVYEETDPFTPRIRYFDFPKKNRMSSNVKTYNGSEDPEDHLKIFQAAAKAKAAKKGEASRKDKTLAILIVQPLQMVARQKITQSFAPDLEIPFPPLEDEDGTEDPMIIETEIGGHFIHRMYIDGGSASEILYEHCFNRLHPEVKSQMVPATAPIISLSGEIIWLMGQTSLPVKIGDAEHSTSTWMNFVVVRSPSPYNRIIGRPGVRKSSSPVNESWNVKLPSHRKNTHTSKQQDYPTRMYDGLKTGGKTFCQNSSRGGKNQSGNSPKIPGANNRVPWHIAEHRLNIHEGCVIVRQKKRIQTPERNKAIQEEVEKLVEAGIMKEVHYHSWLANPVMIKRHDNSWRMCVDSKDLNKACPKDGYPLLEIDWKVESLYGYPFKCFLYVHRVLVGNYYLPLISIKGAGYRHVKVLEFFDYSSPRQGVEDLRESLHKHRGSKQVGFKQLGPGVETGVHIVHDEKRVWLEVELQGAQGDREVKVFQSGVAKHLGVAGTQQQNGLVDEINVILFANVRCFLIQSVLYRNIGFNESGEYKKTFIGFGVHDMLIACKSKAEIGSTKPLLKREFDMKDLEEAKKILGMEIVRDRSRKILRVSQSGYISKILNNFRIDNGKSVQMPLGGHFKLSLKDCPIRDCDVERMSKVPYANAVGSLMYLMVCTRPDIAYAVYHWLRIFSTGMCCKLEDNVTTHGGSFNYIGGVYGPYRGYEGVIHLSQNHVFHERTKHINVRYHFIKEVLEAKTIEVLKVGTEHNAADALMKVVPGHKLQHCLELLSVGIG